MDGVTVDERTLTKADIDAIALAVRQNSCSIGISREDAAELCEFAAWMRKLKKAIGNVVIYGFILFLGVLFYMGIGRWKE
jgi:methylmalonyl-CoA mutase cobalamin-binding subunit